MTFKN